MTERRERTVAIALCGVGAALALLAAGRTWVRVSVDLPRPLPDTSHALAGQDLAPVAGALGVAGLAGLAGIVATRGYARLAVGLLLTILGLAVAYASVRGVGQGSVQLALAAEDVLIRGAAVDRASTAWWAVSVVGGGLMTVAGALTVARGRRWPGLSRRYDRPPSSPAASRKAEEDEGWWESIDHGKDPTA